MRISRKETLSRSMTNRLKVFLCHASQDKPFVRNLYHRLLAEGMEPWFDEENLLPGQEWDQVIRSELRKSDAIIICLSSHAVNKAGYVQKEIKQALDVAEEQPEGTIFLIPVRIEDCEMPSRLSHLHSPILTKDNGLNDLLAALKVRATSIGRLVTSTPPSPAVNQLMRENFSRAFAQVFWERYPEPPDDSSSAFTISLIGHAASGKTSLGSVLADGEFDFFRSRMKGSEPYIHRFRMGKNAFVTDYPSYSVDSEDWDKSLRHMRVSSGLIVFLTSYDTTIGPSDLKALAELQKERIPLTVVANKIDLCPAKQVVKYIRYLEDCTRSIPLPVSAATGLNIKLLRKFFAKGQKMYTA